MKSVASKNPAENYTLAIFYENINYSPSGATETLRITGSPCTVPTTDIEYTRSDLTSYPLRDVNWNDRISSLRTFQHCDAKLFTDTHGHGASTGWIDSNSDLRSYQGGWNDRASSIRLS